MGDNSAAGLLRWRVRRNAVLWWKLVADFEADIGAGTLAFLDPDRVVQEDHAGTMAKTAFD